MRLASLHRGRPVHPQRQHRLDPGGTEVSSREDAKCPPAGCQRNPSARGQEDLESISIVGTVLRALQNAVWGFIGTVQSVFQVFPAMPAKAQQHFRKT